jgi:hypothetical protein
LRQRERKPSYIVLLGGAIPAVHGAVAQEWVQWFILCGLGKRHGALGFARAKTWQQGRQFCGGRQHDIGSWVTDKDEVEQIMTKPWILLAD